jgi:hypothetical protein
MAYSEKELETMIVELEKRISTNKNLVEFAPNKKNRLAQQDIDRDSFTINRLRIMLHTIRKDNNAIQDSPGA